MGVHPRVHFRDMNYPPTIPDPQAAELEQLRRRVAELERQLASRCAPPASLTNLAILLDNTTDAVWSIDDHQRLVYFNRSFAEQFERLLGRTPILGAATAELLPEALRKEWVTIHRRALGGESFSVEQEHQVGGESRVYHVWLHPIATEGAVSGVALFSRDVTEYRQAQDKLLQQSGILQLVLDSISDGVLVVDQQGRLAIFNPASARILGITPMGERFNTWSSHFGLFLPDMVTPYPTEALPLVRALRGEAVDEADLYLRNETRPEGAWLSVSARPLIDGSSVPKGGVAVFRDVTERRKAREALAAEQQFLEQLLLAHERDRQLVAYEIHDGLVQEITGALMHLESIWPQQQPAAGSFELALKLLRDALDEGRRLISGLRPPILDEMGIVAAVDYLVSEHVSQGVSAIRFNHDVHFDRLEPLLEGTIFRIVQEALNNIKRHSRAPTASVDLSHIGERIQIQVRDTGVGFDPSQVDKRRFGLKGIRERARLLGGRAAIESAPGQGTRVYVEIPVAYAIQLGSKRSYE